MDKGALTKSNRGMGVKMFFGILLLVLGLSIIINVFFKVDIPVFRVVFGLFVIYLGFHILVGPSKRHWGKVHVHKSDNAVVFTSGEFKPQTLEDLKNEYSAVFGSAKLDLSQVDFGSSKEELEANAVFGELTVILPKNLPVKLELSSVAGHVQSPSDAENPSGAQLAIEANAVFGSVKITRAP